MYIKASVPVTLTLLSRTRSLPRDTRTCYLYQCATDGNQSGGLCNDILHLARQVAFKFARHFISGINMTDTISRVYRLTEFSKL